MALTLAPGSLVSGKYRLLRLLGVGGMANVWSAQHALTEKRVAIKFLLSELARTDEAVQRFLLEAKVSARVSHPNIVEVFDVGQCEDGRLFLVMELLDGSTLEAALERTDGRLRLSEFSRVMADVARALAAAHRAGIVHRDLKPSNIFLHKPLRNAPPVTKVLDFGVSKFLGTDDKLTQAGSMLGSPLYMSPEQAIGSSAIDQRSDIFSFGAILFEALVSHRCYEAPNFNALVVRIATGAPDDIDRAAPHLPEAFRTLVKECLIANPTHRLLSMDVIAERLMQIAYQAQLSDLELPLLMDRPKPTPPSPAPLSIPPLTTATTAPKATPDKRPLLFGFAALAVLLGGLGGGSLALRENRKGDDVFTGAAPEATDLSTSPATLSPATITPAHSHLEAADAGHATIVTGSINP